MVAMKRIAKKSDVWSHIQKGELIRVHLDTETTALERDFAQITAYGDAVGDIAGNFIDSMELLVKRPDRYLPSPQACLVTRTSPEELDDPSRILHRLAMGQIAQRVTQAARMITNLDLPEKEVSFSTVRRIGGDKYEKSFTEDIVEYPLLDDQGNITHDVRYHPDRNIVAYRFSDDPKSPYYENVENNYYVDQSDNSKWKMVDTRVSVRGYRMKWADMYWLRANLVRAGFHPSNIFFTHSKATITNKQMVKNYATDTYTVVQAVSLFGPQGEEGLKIGTRKDQRTGLDVPTAKLEKVMEENTRLENKQRGVRGGVLMPDQTVYNAASAHRSPAYDAKADFAIFNYCMDIAPHVVRAVDRQSDEQDLRRQLSGTDPVKPHPPIFALPRNTFPYAPVADPVAFLGFDDQMGQLRKVIMPRLDYNLRTYRYANKKLVDMSSEDLVQMMKDQARKPEALIRFESVRRWPGSMNLFQDALTSAGRNGWDIEQILDSFQFLKENPEVCERIREAAEIINVEVGARVEPANPMMEEQATRNGFGDLDYLESDADSARYSGLGRPMSKQGALPSYSEMIFEKARDIYNYHNAVDEILHRLALQPHPVDWMDDEEALKNFKDLVLRAKRHFNKKKCPYGDVFKDMFDRNNRFKLTTCEAAREARWKLMKRFLEDDEKERKAKQSKYGEGLFDYKYTQNGRVLFGNLSRDFRIVDYKGRELDTEYLKQQYYRHPLIVQKKFEKGDWRIQFYRLSSEPSVTAALFQFADAGKMDELSPVWRVRYKALKNLYLNGAPNEDSSEMRWQSLPVIEEALKRIEINAQTDSPEGLSRNFSQYAKGDADIFVKTDEGQRIVAKFRSWINKIKLESKLSEVEQRLLHFDPQSNIAYDRIEHEVPAEDIMVINVPDPMLRKPLDDIRYAPYSFVVGGLTEEQKKKIEKGVPVIFKGEQTGRMYYGGAVSVRKLPAGGKGFENYLDLAKKAYEEDAGVKFPEESERSVLIVQKPQPVANSRPDGMDLEMQTIKVPSAFFDGLVTPRLAHFDHKKPFTGLVMPVMYSLQKLEEGKPVRFREMDALMGAKLEGNEARDTGHIYESKKLAKVVRMTVGDLYEKVSSGEISDTQARHCGFASGFDMWEKVNNGFLTHESPDPSKEEIYMLEFDRVNARSWAYFNPPRAPEAAFSYGGQPVPPSAYRWTAPVANENKKQPVLPANRRARRNQEIKPE